MGGIYYQRVFSLFSVVIIACPSVSFKALGQAIYYQYIFSPIKVPCRPRCGPDPAPVPAVVAPAQAAAPAPFPA